VHGNERPGNFYVASATIEFGQPSLTSIRALKDPAKFKRRDAAD